MANSSLNAASRQVTPDRADPDRMLVSPFNQRGDLRARALRERFRERAPPVAAPDPLEAVAGPFPALGSGPDRNPLAQALLLHQRYDLLDKHVHSPLIVHPG